MEFGEGIAVRAIDAFVTNKSRDDERKHLVLQGAAVCNRRPTQKAISNRLSLKLFDAMGEISLERTSASLRFKERWFAPAVCRRFVNRRSLGKQRAAGNKS
jgi:hypothetical protein